MSDILFQAIGNLEAYEQWLKNKGINPHLIINAEVNVRKMLLRAFSRVNKNWNLTKKQKLLIKKLKN